MATSNQEKMNKMKNALEYQVKHFASNIETAKKFGVTSGTIVKWRNQIAETDQRLYHYSKLVADQYNSTKQKRRTNIYVHIIAHLIVRYHLTLEQAITLSGYKIAPARVSTLLSKSIEKESKQQLKYTKQEMEVIELLKQKDADVVEFARFEKGEGIEKKEENFAEEVMNQLK